MTYVIMCDLDADRSDEYRQRRDDHRAYVAAQIDRIAFGGIVHDGAGEPVAIHYYVRVADEADAWSLVDADPYRTLHRTVSVQPFEQRAPEQA